MILSQLTKVERFLETDIRYVLKGGAWLTVGQIITTGFSFLLSLVLANLLLPETYGMYRYILSLAAMIGTLSLGGLGTAITRAVSQGFEGSYIRGAKVSFKWSILIVLASAAGAAYYFIRGNELLGTGMLIVGAFTPFIDTSELFTAYLNGKKLFGTLATWRIIRSFGTTLVIVGTVLITKNVLWIVLSYFLSHLLFAGASFLWTIYFLQPKKEESSEAISLGKHLSLINFFAGITDKVDNIIVFHFLGPVQLAVYTFALLMPTHILGLIKNLGVLAIPRFAERDKKEVRETLYRKSGILLLVTLPITIVYILAAPYIFEIFFPQYVAAITLSQVFAITILMSGTILMAFFDSQHAIKEKYILSIVSSVVKVPILLIGVIFFGLWGAIVGKIISKAFGLALAYVMAKRV